MTVILCPLLGILSDKIGFKSIFLIVSACLYTVSFILFLILPTCPEVGGCEFNFILPLVINGIGLATYFSVVFAAVTVLVEKKLLGTAFGILDCF